MTLKEKFNKLVPKEFGGMQEPLLSDCEKIADDYAIEFAEWFWINKDKFYKEERDFYLEFNQLLQLFKKEKGL